MSVLIYFQKKINNLTWISIDSSSNKIEKKKLMLTNFIHLVCPSNQKFKRRKQIRTRIRDLTGSNGGGRTAWGDDQRWNNVKRVCNQTWRFKPRKNGGVLNGKLVEIFLIDWGWNFGLFGIVFEYVFFDNKNKNKNGVL